MINFPVWGGTTGHLLGAALATILLGPYAAVIVISVILIIQCLVFGDGGLTALGLNIANMAIVGCLSSWLIFRPISRRSNRAGVLLAAWTSVFVAAAVTAAELTISYDMSGGTYGIVGTLSIPLMLGYHALIGIGEAIITSVIFIYLSKVAPDTLRMRIGKKETAS
jgi:cobalt/nickel transport system permease protein